MVQRDVTRGFPNHYQSVKSSDSPTTVVYGFLLLMHVNQNLSLSVGNDICFLHHSAICPDPLTAKVNNLNFHPRKVVSRYRDPQLHVGENYSYLFYFRPNICKSRYLTLSILSFATVIFIHYKPQIAVATLDL